MLPYQQTGNGETVSRKSSPEKIAPKETCTRKMAPLDNLHLTNFLGRGKFPREYSSFPSSRFPRGSFPGSNLPGNTFPSI